MRHLLEVELSDWVVLALLVVATPFVLVIAVLLRALGMIADAFRDLFGVLRAPRD